MASNFINESNCFSLTTTCSKVTKLPYGVNPAYLGHRTHLVTDVPLYFSVGVLEEIVG